MSVRTIPVQDYVERLLAVSGRYRVPNMVISRR